MESRRWRSSSLGAGSLNTFVSTLSSVGEHGAGFRCHAFWQHHRHIGGSCSKG